MAWRQIITRDKVSPDAPFAFQVEEREFAIFQVGDSYHALDNICPHAFALMSEGFVEGDKVECPLHGAVFHIPTGLCLAPPADSDLKSYPVRVEGDQILVDV
jgi:3-phenylpropionate/trans-cinnamate dioxygenase ferredoxin subunit